MKLSDILDGVTKVNESLSMRLGDYSNAQQEADALVERVGRARETKQNVEAATAGAVSGATFGAVENPELAQAHPNAYMAGQLVGGVGSFMATGGLLQEAGLGIKAVQLGKAALAAKAVGQYGPRFIPGMIMSGATFGTHAGVVEAVDQIKKGELNLMDMGKEITKNFAYGAGFGFAGALVSRPAAAVVAGTIGYGSAKADGADESHARLNGAIWAASELILGHGRGPELLKQQVNNVKESLTDFVQARGVTDRKVASIIAEKQMLRMSEGDINKWYESPESTVGRLEKLNKDIYDATQKAKEQPKLTAEAPKTGETAKSEGLPAPKAEEPVKTTPEAKPPVEQNIVTDIEEAKKYNGLPPPPDTAVPVINVTPVVPPRTLADVYKEQHQMAEELRKKNMDTEQAGKLSKGAGMERSAVLRKLNEKPTPIEVKNEIKELDRFYVGKQVETPDGPGTVTAKPVYGRVEVTGTGMLFQGVPKKYKTSELKFVPATKEEAIKSLKMKAEKEAHAFLESRGMKYKPEQNLRMVAVTHPTADSFVASQGVKPGSKKEYQMRELWRDADLDKAITEYVKIAERVGAKIEKIEKVDEVHTINMDTPEGRRLLMEQGYSEKEIQNAIDTGAVAVVKGTHTITRRNDGSEWSTIRLYKGADRRDLAEELAHSVEEQGGIPGWAGGKEEHAKYIAKSIITGEIDKISEFTAAGTKVTIKSPSGTVEAKSVQDIVGTVQHSVEITYDSKYMELKAGEGVEFVDKMPMLEAKSPVNTFKFYEKSPTVTEGEYAGYKEMYAHADIFAKKMRNNEFYVAKDADGEIYFVATGEGADKIPAFKYPNPLKVDNVKVKAYIWSVPAIYTCRNCKSCAAACYAIGPQEQYALTKLWRFANLYMFLNHRGTLKSLINEQLKGNERNIVRWHESGDVFSQPYIQFLEGIIKENPDKKFYLYTKVTELDFAPLDVLPNFNRVESMLPDGSRNFGPLEYVERKSKELGVKICPATRFPEDNYHCATQEWKGKGKKCDACTREKHMLFVEHGTPIRGKAVKIMNDIRDTNYQDNIQYSIKIVPKEEFAKMKGKKATQPPPPKVEKVEQEVPPGEKVSGLSTSVEDLAVERGLIDTLGNKPTYATRNMADAAKRANAIINKDKQLALDIAFERVPEQGDVRSQEMFTALSVRAAMEGDVGLIYELGLSQEAANIAAEAGQRVKAYDNGLDVDPVAAIQELKQVRAKAAEQKIGKKKIETEKKAEVKKIKEEIAKADTVDDWAAFIKTLEC